MGALLRFENICVKYGETTVIRDFSADIEAGDFFALIGPNGSGKSTLINAVLGQCPLYSGRIMLKDRPIETYKAKERARIVSVVPQKFYTAFDFTAYDIVMMGRNPHMGRFSSATQEDLDAVEHAMRIADVYKYKNRKITSLSGGECQRVVIAGALAQSPELLILDEPTNHLDLYHSLDIMRIIKTLNTDNGLTVFAVLHDINSAARFSDKIAVLHEGNKVCCGSVDDVVREDVLRKVYNIDLIVRKNDLTGSKEIVPIRSIKDKMQNRNKTVHVISGGGSGASLLESLSNCGYRVSCGVINAGDTDYEVCASLGLETASEAPYSAVSESAYRKNQKLIDDAAVIILTDTPIGTGNLKNIEILKDLKKQKLYIIEAHQRDYADGKADAVIENLLTTKKAQLISKNVLQKLIQQEKL
jgi:iron complex transport system ATP-binding protein